MNAQPQAHWHQRIAPQLLPRSEEQSIVERALDEWVYGRECRDHLIAEETCELCLQKNLRWHFQIGNQATSQTLWIGSECIKRFDLGVWDQATSQVVHGAAASKLVAADQKKLEEVARIRRLSDLVDKAAALEPDQHDQTYWRQAKAQLVEKRPFTPARLDYLLQALEHLGLPFPVPKDVRLAGCGPDGQRDLAALTPSAWLRIRPYCTESARVTAEILSRPREETRQLFARVAARKAAREAAGDYEEVLDDDSSR